LLATVVREQGPCSTPRFPTIDPRTIDQLTGVLPVPDVKLTAETMKKLDVIWPGPGGE